MSRFSESGGAKDPKLNGVEEEEEEEDDDEEDEEEEGKVRDRPSRKTHRFREPWGRSF
jgi:hypothetical protein